jgi:hypothetical protein
MKKILFLITLATTAFILNLAWEVAHSLLYSWDPVISSYIPFISFMALKDAMWVIIFYLATAFVFKDIFWFQIKKNGWLLISLLGFAFSVVIEWQALATGRWQYGDYMPIVPLLGVGLTPILQMTFLPALSVFLSKKVFGPIQNANS